MSCRHVLLLEDDPAPCGLLQEALSAEGLQVTACTSFLELRASAARRIADLVVADFWGGGQSTLAAGEREQIVSLTSLLPVILLTGRTWAADTSAEELGAAALIRKPFDLGDLLETIERVLSFPSSGPANH